MHIQPSLDDYRPIRLLLTIELARQIMNSIMQQERMRVSPSSSLSLSPCLPVSFRVPLQNIMFDRRVVAHGNKDDRVVNSRGSEKRKREVRSGRSKVVSP